MWRRLNPRHIFISAIALLFFSVAAAGWIIYRLYQSERWVRHSFEVQLTLDSIASELSEAGRARAMFVNSGNPQYLPEFDESSKNAYAGLAHVRRLTADNSEQLHRSDRLEANIRERIGVSQKIIDLVRTHSTDKEAMSALTTSAFELANETSAIVEEMGNAEQVILGQRRILAEKLFRLIVTVLFATFLLAIFLIWEHYRRLVDELRDRSLAEQNSRKLSLELLRAQDAERRRISRELHDGFGQNLTAAKILADTYLRKHPNDEIIADLATILEDTLNSARTMSYLLHPPLLDEIGLASAAEWLVEGFSKRTGINVSFGVEGTRRRLGEATELTLFRVLQESLTNIHRHARTSGAEVVLRFESDQVGLRVHDFGVGIPAEKLEEFDERGVNKGLGLTGMKHRVQDQLGKFHLSSNASGTTIRVELPAN